MEHVETVFVIEMACKTKVTLTGAACAKIKRANAQRAKEAREKMRRGIGKGEGEQEIVEERFRRRKEHLVREVKRRRRPW